MRRVGTSNTFARIRGPITVLASVVIACGVSADLMVINAAGVRAGITGIVYRSSDNSIGVKWAVVDPAGTNVTAFTFQQSPDLINWVNSFPTNTVVGNSSGEASGGFATSTKRFYRMQLINF